MYGDSSTMTVQAIATDRNLWEEYVDPADDAPYDTLSLEQRMELIREIWPNTPEGVDNE